MKGYDGRRWRTPILDMLHLTYLLENQLEILMLLLSRFSRVQLCATQTAAHQALLTLGFSRQEYWSGMPFPSAVHESEK